MNQTIDLSRLSSALLIPGDAQTAYRDPAAIYEAGVFHLYCTMVENLPGETQPYLRLAEFTSRDLLNWDGPHPLTPRDRSCNWSSPGSVVRNGSEWILCLQTYCRPNGEKYGNSNSRVFLMRSCNLADWSQPELIRVHGKNVAREDMGRMIDPFLLKTDDGWWCFFKQNGVSYSFSKDMNEWEYKGSSAAGENVCVLPYGTGYRMFSSPENGIRIMDSNDLVHWTQRVPDLYLGQKDWPWTHGRLTAAFVMEAPDLPGLPRYLMFFHGSQFSEAEAFDSYASIGLAWSEDLTHWSWPQE